MKAAKQITGRHPVCLCGVEISGGCWHFLLHANPCAGRVNPERESHPRAPGSNLIAPGLLVAGRIGRLSPIEV